MSSRNSGIAGSKPPTCSQTSRRTSIPALLTASASRSPSCWPWSTSRGSMPVIRRPAVSMVIPASRRTWRSAQSMTLGPSTAADRPRSRRGAAAPARPGRARSRRAAATATRPARCRQPRPEAHRDGRRCGAVTRAGDRRAVAGARGPCRTRPCWPSRSASTAPLRSRLPVSTATTRCTGRVWPSRASMTCGSHAAPSWATMTAVTTCWAYVFVRRQGSACCSSGHLRGTASGPARLPARARVPVNNTRT